MASFFQSRTNAEMKDEMKTVRLRELSESMWRKEMGEWDGEEMEKEKTKAIGRECEQSALSLLRGWRQKEKLEPREEGGKKGGEQERAVWLIETESTDRKSLSCHWAERQSLYILLTTTLFPSALSPVSSLHHPHASLTQLLTHRRNSFYTGGHSQKRAFVFIRRPIGGLSFGMAALEGGMTNDDCLTPPGPKPMCFTRYTGESEWHYSRSSHTLKMEHCWLVWNICV